MAAAPLTLEWDILLQDLLLPLSQATTTTLLHSWAFHWLRFKSTNCSSPSVVTRRPNTQGQCRKIRARIPPAWEWTTGDLGRPRSVEKKTDNFRAYSITVFFLTFKNLSTAFIPGAQLRQRRGNINICTVLFIALGSTVNQPVRERAYTFIEEEEETSSSIWSLSLLVPFGCVFIFQR